MRSAAGAVALCHALLLVTFILPPQVVVAERADQEPSEEGSCMVDSACLTSLALTAQKDPAALSGYKNVSTAVLSCVGANRAIIRPLRLLMPSYAEGTVEVLRALVEGIIGWDFEPQFAAPEMIGAMVLETEATGRTYYDGWITEASWTPDLAIQGMIEPLDSYVNADPEIEWLDVSRFIRSASAVFNGSVVGVPVGGSMYLMHWRKDVFKRAGLSPPNTWREAITVANALNGTDFNKDGIPDYALCLDIFEATDPLDLAAREVGSLLNQILASQTQTQGASSGWLFSPDTMDSFVDSPAMIEVLAILSELLLYSSRFTNYYNPELHPFAKGSCALHFTSIDMFKGTQMTGKFKGLFGSAPLPGSELVLDRKSGKLVSCSTELCPYATWNNISSTAAGGATTQTLKLVNRASYSSYSSTLGMINANSLSIYKAAMYRLFALISSYKMVLQTMLGPGPIGPFRQRLLSRTNASLALWTSRGYNKADMYEYLGAMQATLDHPNNALDLRIQHALDYRGALIQATFSLVRGKDVAAVQSNLSARYAAITAMTPLQQLGDGYLAGLNVKRRFVLPTAPLTPVTPPPPTVFSAAASSSSGLRTPQEVGIIVSSVVGGLLLLIAAVALAMARGRTHRRWGFFGTHLPPGVGAGTTLVVTDIENSTLLWEEIPQDVMNAALTMHHTLVRKLLVKHQGYESATEGDSFIATFHTPLDALQFSQAFQAGLLVLDWPSELLECHLSCPVWVQPTGGDINHQEGAKSPKPDMSDLRFSVSGQAADDIPAYRTTMNGRSAVSAGNDSQRLMLQRQRSRVALELQRSEGANLIAPVFMDSYATAGHTTLLAALELTIPKTALSAIQDGWGVCDAPHPGSDPKADDKRMVYRGLRVRVGLHSGLDNPADAVLNATTGRMQYSGLLLYTAKAVGDCGHGGMVLLSHACFNALPSASLQSMGSVINMGEFAFTKAGGSEVVPPGALYQVVASDVQPRLALLDCKLRSVTQLQVGALQAPVNNACIAFANVVGTAALMAWNANVASRALELYQRKAVGMLMANNAGTGHGPPSAMRGSAGMVLGSSAAALMNNGGQQPEPPGYVVELASGLCLAAFQTPASALLWALRLIDSLLEAEWEPELLAHGLCEEVCIGGSGPSHFRTTAPPRASAPLALVNVAGIVPESPSSPQRVFNCAGGEHHQSSGFHRQSQHTGSVLFRGLRLKIGVDMGSVHANINPCTGRMAYRGRVMNRSARIADKAGSGQVWSSKAVVNAYNATAGLHNVIQTHPLGSVSLKGVTEPVELLQCVLVEVDPHDMYTGLFENMDRLSFVRTTARHS